MAEPESQSEPDGRDEALPHLDVLHRLGPRLSGGDQAPGRGPGGKGLSTSDTGELREGVASLLERTE